MVLKHLNSRFTNTKNYLNISLNYGEKNKVQIKQISN